MYWGNPVVSPDPIKENSEDLEEESEEVEEQQEQVQEEQTSVQPNLDSGKLYVTIFTVKDNENRAFMAEHTGMEFEELSENEIELLIYSQDDNYNNDIYIPSGGTQLCQGDDFYGTVSAFRRYITDNTPLSIGVSITECVIVKAVDPHGLLTLCSELKPKNLITQHESI